MLIPLAHALVSLLEEAACSTLNRDAPLGVENLLMALRTTSSLGSRLATAIRKPEDWRARRERVPTGNLAIWARERFVPLDAQSERLILDGAQAVLLGPYEPRHLAEAIGAAAELHPERFTRFGFDAPAWRRALRVRIGDH